MGFAFQCQHTLNMPMSSSASSMQTGRKSTNNKGHASALQSVSQLCLWCYTQSFLVLVFLIPAHLIATYGQFQQLTKYFLFCFIYVTAFWSHRSLRPNKWQLRSSDMPSAFKNNSSNRNSASLTHKFPSLHAGWLLCCFILVLMIPFSLMIWPRYRQTDTGSIWKRLPLSAALRQAPDNWQTGQRKGAEKIHCSLIAWILTGLYI